MVRSMTCTVTADWFASFKLIATSPAMIGLINQMRYLNLLKRALAAMQEGALEEFDVENLRRHYVKTLHIYGSH
jgi:hypothetical protein